MHLYTYMDVGAYVALNTHGRLVGCRERSIFPEFSRAYAWLGNAMEVHIGPPPEGCHGDWPVFAWEYREGLHPLRHEESQGKADGPYRDLADILVGFDAPEGTFLLSDFDDWHFVLNNWFLPSVGSSIDETEEGDEFDRFSRSRGRDPFGHDNLPPVPEVEAARSKNWNRIFEYPHENGTTQASLWELRAEWVYLVKVRSAAALRAMGDLCPLHVRREPVATPPMAP